MKKQIILAGVLAAISAQANTISFSDSEPLATTNWGQNNHALGSFDSNLGTLTKVQVFINGSVLGNIQVESLDAQPSTVTSQLKADVKIVGPGGSAATAVPTAPFTDNLGSFDGSIDFGGGSGKSHLGATGSASASYTKTAPIDLAPYITVGPGSVNFLVDAKGTSTANGAGNLITLFQTKAGADFKVVYTYDPVQTPDVGSTLALIPAALVGLSMFRRRN